MGSGLLDLAGGPVGLSLAAVTAGVGAYSFIQNKNSYKPDDAAYNPLLKYNEVLGIVTQSNQNFSTALNNATKQLPKPTTTAEALNMSSTAVGIATAPGRPMTNTNTQNYKTPQTAASYLRTLDAINGGKMTPQQLQAVGMDFIERNGVSFWNQTVQAYHQGRGTGFSADIATPVKEAEHYQRAGFSPFHSGQTKDILATTIGGIQARATTGAGLYGQKYGTQIAGTDVAQLLYSAYQTGDRKTMNDTASLLQSKNLLPKDFDWNTSLGGGKNANIAGRVT